MKRTYAACGTAVGLDKQFLIELLRHTPVSKPEAEPILQGVVGGVGHDAVGHLPIKIPLQFKNTGDVDSFGTRQTPAALPAYILAQFRGIAEQLFPVLSGHGCKVLRNPQIHLEHLPAVDARHHDRYGQAESISECLAGAAP